jgi:hypothetical protein
VLLLFSIHDAWGGI